VNIDYAAIIAKANERKDALIKFELAMQELFGEINESLEPDLIIAARHWVTAWNKLDAEAKEMVSASDGHQVHKFLLTLLQSWRLLDTGDTWNQKPRDALYKMDSK
jgi:hypothetical protein